MSAGDAQNGADVRHGLVMVYASDRRGQAQSSAADSRRRGGGGHARAILSDLRGMSLKRRERETLLILHLHELLLMYIFLSRRPSFRTEEPATATAAAPTAIFLRYSKEGTRPSRLSDTPNHHKLPRARPSFPSLTLTT